MVKDQKAATIEMIVGMFHRYLGDEKLLLAVKESGNNLELFGYKRVGYYLTREREIFRGEGHMRSFSSPIDAAEAFVEYFSLQNKQPITLIKAKELLERDLGKRVERLKKDYVKKYAN